MELIEIIIDILNNTEEPLRLREIRSKVREHKEYLNCNELQKVKEEAAAISRCLSKFSTGSRPTFGIFIEETNKAKKFYLRKNQKNPIKIIPELELHPYLVKFVNKKFNVFSKTINASKILGKIGKIGKWTNPDIVGINPLILNINNILQDEAVKIGMFSSKVIEFYSFELKIKIDNTNVIESFFQTVSNSSWANYGYLVVGDLDNNSGFLSNLERLNNVYGIGIIKLNIENPEKSEIIIPARKKDNVDINFINFLLNRNKDFSCFIKTVIETINNKRININDFDKIV
jgi:hypothetical protein